MVAPTASSDTAPLLLGVALPVDGQAWMLSHTRKNDKTAVKQDAAQLVLGYHYCLAWRTDVYTAYARFRNKNGAGYTAGGAIGDGTGNRAIHLGMRHVF